MNNAIERKAQAKVSLESAINALLLIDLHASIIYVRIFLT